MSDAARVALISGAGRGIGRAAALRLGGAGWRLALLARSDDELRRVAAEAGAALPLPCDVTDADAVAAAVAAAVSRFGRLDAVIHCAGAAVWSGVEDLSVAQWRAVLDTNLSSAFYLAKAAWPAWRRQGSGVFVAVASLASRDPLPGFLAYGAAKAGMVSFGTSLARLGAPLGVSVHTIAPGAVETAMLRSLIDETQLPRDRALDPDDVARVIALCADGTLRHASGEVIWLHQGPP